MLRLETNEFHSKVTVGVEGYSLEHQLSLYTSFCTRMMFRLGNPTGRLLIERMFNDSLELRLLAIEMSSIKNKSSTNYKRRKARFCQLVELHLGLWNNMLTDRHFEARPYKQEHTKAALKYHKLAHRLLDAIARGILTKH